MYYCQQLNKELKMKNSVILLERIGKKFALLIIVAFLTTESAAKADTMLMEQGRNNYAGTVSGIGGNLTNATWAGPSTTYYRFGHSTDSAYNTTTLWRFNDSAGLGIGTIMSNSSQQVTVNSATLNLYAQQSSTFGGTFYVAPITEDWTQAASVSGANAPLPTIDTSKAIAVTISSFTAGTYFSFDVTSIVQDWINNSYANYGFAVYTLDANAFVSQVNNEYRTNLGQKPQLSIDYTIAAVPEPSTWVLMIGGVLMLAGSCWYRRHSHC
jgi:hypothetical protein